MYVKYSHPHFVVHVRTVHIRYYCATRTTEAGRLIIYFEVYT